MAEGVGRSTGGLYGARPLSCYTVRMTLIISGQPSNIHLPDGSRATHVEHDLLCIAERLFVHRIGNRIRFWRAPMGIGHHRWKLAKYILKNDLNGMKVLALDIFIYCV